MRERKKMKAYSKYSELSVTLGLKLLLEVDGGGKRTQDVIQEGTQVKSELHRPALGGGKDDRRGGGKA
jgi:hypothetical protein